MARANERGSVVGFVVVGVLLTALVVGGIYVVKNKLASHLDGQTANQTGKEVASNPQKKNTDQPQSKDTDKQQQPTPSNQPTDQQPSSQQPQPSKTEQPSSTSQSSESTDHPSTGSSTPGQSSNLPHTGVEATQLPQTGAADFLISAASIGMLVGSALVYRRSSQL